MLRSLPKPTNFAEGQRQLFGILMAASGVYFGIMGLALTLFFCVLAFKFPEHRETILWITAGSLAACWIGQLAVTISMAVGGPVGRFKVSASREGASLEASGDDEPVDPADDNSAFGDDCDDPPRRRSGYRHA